MTLKERTDAFAELGQYLRTALNNPLDKWYNELNGLINGQHLKNQWFTPPNVRMAVESIAAELTGENLKRWTDAYSIPDKPAKPLTVAVIMAGNIPLVGFHDYLAVLMSGNRLMVKTSSKDEDLIRFIDKLLCSIAPGLAAGTMFTSGNIRDFDVVIATGSNNSARYFEYYFGKYPSIIRKNRNSIAIIDGNEGPEELAALGTDIFSYFGLGCRNVSKLYLPGGYEPAELLRHWYSWEQLVMHSGYANNYDFNKAVYLVNREPFTDGGFVLLRESPVLSSPVSVVHYEYYKGTDITALTGGQTDWIQCIAGHGHIPFGRTQMPYLWDYADNVDTMEFLLKKNRLLTS